MLLASLGGMLFACSWLKVYVLKVFFMNIHVRYFEKSKHFFQGVCKYRLIAPGWIGTCFFPFFTYLIDRVAVRKTAEMFVRVYD